MTIPKEIEYYNEAVAPFRIYAERWASATEKHSTTGDAAGRL
jgi:hypothetical protein